MRAMNERVLDILQTPLCAAVRWNEKSLDIIWGLQTRIVLFM